MNITELMCRLTSHYHAMTALSPFSSRSSGITQPMVTVYLIWTDFKRCTVTMPGGSVTLNLLNERHDCLYTLYITRRLHRLLTWTTLSDVPTIINTLNFSKCFDEKNTRQVTYKHSIIQYMMQPNLIESPISHKFRIHTFICFAISACRVHLEILIFPY